MLAAPGKTYISVSLSLFSVFSPPLVPLFFLSPNLCSLLLSMQFISKYFIDTIFSFYLVTIHPHLSFADNYPTYALYVFPFSASFAPLPQIHHILISLTSSPPLSCSLLFCLSFVHTLIRILFLG